MLVVDDEPSIRRYLRRFLESSGYTVREAGDVDRAVDLLHEVSVDAVVLDLRLPDLRGWKRSGHDVSAFLRLRDDLAGIPVLILTGYPLSQEQEDLLQRRGARVLYKPVGYTTLVRHLDRVTQRSGRRSIPSRPHLPRSSRRSRSAATKIPKTRLDFSVLIDVSPAQGFS